MVGQAYTHWNLALFAIWLSGKHMRARWTRSVGAMLWCNSLSVVASYESVRIINNDAYAGFLNSLSSWREDVIGHWVPILVLWLEKDSRRAARRRHVCAAIALECVWAYLIGFDLAVAYPDIKPPLSATDMRWIWLCGLLGHIAPLRPRMPWWMPYVGWVSWVIRQAVADGR